MPHSLELDAPPRANDCPKIWREFFQAHCDALFQTALLLSADPDEAEASLAATLDSVDLSKPPSESQFLMLQGKLARRTIQITAASASPKISEAGSLLQAGLHPVLQIERFPRVCFVLRTLLGYATSSCAQMLGIDEAAVRTLLRIAILQLHNTVTGTSSRPSWLAESIDVDGWSEYPVVGSLIDRDGRSGEDPGQDPRRQDPGQSPRFLNFEVCEGALLA